MQPKPAHVALFAVDAFVALTAVGGGIALATGIEGDRFPETWLQGTPFHSYVVPGIILAGVVGGSAAVAVVATARSARAGGPASMAAGAIMMGWIIGEVVMLEQPWTRGRVSEAVYFTLGLMMVVLGSRVRETAADRASRAEVRRRSATR